MRRLLVLVLALAISHLSYAISSSLAQDPDGSSPIRGVGGEMHPDLFTGTATTSIPIDLPPGRNGTRPNLQFVYSSGVGNGPLGMGWRLEVGAVERQTRFGVDYTTDDYTFRLSGSSLDLVQAPPPAPSNEYQAKIEENFTRIQKLTAVDGQPYWLATDRKGTKYFFGQTAASRVADLTPPARIFKWCLDRVEDRDGNYFTVTYIGDQGDGYIDEIRYTGWSTTIQPTNLIKFYWDNTGRTDKPGLYTSNYKIVTAKRLKTVAVWADLAMTKLIRAYRLQYTQSSVTGNSLLTDVRQYGKDASVTGGNVTGASFFPSTVLTWTQGSANWASAGSLADLSPAQGFTTGNTAVASNCCSSGSRSMRNLLQQMPNLLTLLGNPQTNYPTLSGDWNGDGKTDVGRVSGTGLVFYVSNGNGTWSSGGTISGNLSPGQGYTNDNTHPMLLGDWDGDGKTDVGRVSGSGVTFYRSNGAGGWALFGSGLANFSPAQGYADANTKPLLTGDWNKDGKTDLGRVSGSGVTFYVSDGTGGWIPFGSGLATFSPAQGYTNADTHPLTIGDWNGDGKMDVGRVNGNAVGFYISDGVGGWTSFGSGLADFSPAQGFADANTKPLLTGDWNGDGKTDVGRVNATGVGFYVSTGVGGWEALSGLADFSPAQGLTNANTYPIFTGDWNGDSKSDVGRVTANGISFYRFDGNVGWVAGPGNIANLSPAQGFADGYTKPLMIGDWNGDGKIDVGRISGTGVSFYSEASPYPDLVASLVNGIGGATTITYTPSPQLPTTQTQLPYPVQTVTSLTTTDGNGTSSTTTYSYTGGYHHLGEREFRGFQMVQVTSPGTTDADQTLSNTWFHQGSRVDIGETEAELDADASAYMKGKVWFTEVRQKVNIDFLYHRTEMTYLSDLIGSNTTAPWFNPPSQVDRLVCEGGTCTTTRVTFAASDYDAYGNVKKESHHGNLAVTGDEKTIERAFVVNTTNYIVSTPIRETVYKGLSVAAVDKLAEALFYYDGTGTGACTAAPTGSNTTVTKGHLTKTERWLSGGTNPISGMEHDPTTGVLLCSRDPLGNKTVQTYDPTKTFSLTTTNQLGHVITSVYSGVNGVAIDPATGFYGTVKTVTDPNGKVVSHEYDALGHTTKTTAPDGLVTTVIYPALAEYGVIGTQKVTTSSSGASLPAALTSSTFFDGLGRTITNESSGSNGTTLVTKTEYTVKGQVSRTSLPYFKTGESVTGRWSTMSYDPLGRVIQITHPDTLGGTLLTTKSCYAPFVTVTLDPSGARKRETKDAYGRVVKIEEYSTTASTCDTAVGTPYATTNYTYDLLGNLTKVVDALGNRTTMRYDTLNRKIAMSDPDMSTNGTVTCGDLTALTPNTVYPWYAAPCWNYQYDATGNLTRQTDAKTQHLWFRYDGLNRRTQKDYTTQKAAGSGDVQYVYDDTVTTFNRKGRLKQVVDAATNVTFEYDARGRVSKSSKVLDGTTYITTSTYDGLGRLKEVTYPGATPKTVEYLYAGPVLERVRDKTGSGTTIYAIYSNYTSQGQAQTITYGNGVVTTSTFADPAHSTCIPANSFKLCTLKTQKGTNPLYQDFTYTFTADGNVDLITDPINGNQDFGYDALDRLNSAFGPYGTGGATATLTYSYNQIGNILTNSQLTGGNFTYPTSGAGVVRPHAVQVAGPYQYSYDNNGNQMGITSTLGDYSSSTTFNVDNRLASAVTTFGSTTITSTFVYDGDGGRVKKIVGTTTTRYISKLYECDTTGANTSCSRYIWAGDTRIATVAVTSGAAHYWHGDHLGSSSVITDSTGAKAQALTYSPYGGPRTNQSFTTPAVDVPYKYTGKEFDYSTDFYYYEFRYYDPWFGRFISPDSIVPNPGDPQDLNRYTYAGNNPLRYTDPTGHFKCCNFKKFFQRALGDTGTAVLGTALQFMGPVGIVNTFLLGSAVLTQSEAGRYVLAAEIVTASAVATFYCGGCGATVTIGGIMMATIPAAATVGAVGVGTLGAISAANAGGDISTGLLMGTALGAAAGAASGYLGGLAPEIGAFSWSPAFFGKAAVAGLANMTGGAILNGASGAAIGFAGGRGNWDTILQTAGRSIAAGATTNAATTLLGLSFNAGSSATGNYYSFDANIGFPIGASISKSLVTDVANFLRLVPGKAPEYSELSNR